MSETVKNHDYNFSLIEKDLINDFQKNEGLLNITPPNRTNVIVLKGDIVKYTFTIHCVPDEKRTIEVEQFIKSIPSNVVNVYYSEIPLELSRIIKNNL